jgi:hypothetical protein
MYDFPYGRKRQTATLTFGPDGRLIGYDAPPKYGTPDESLFRSGARGHSDRCRANIPTTTSDQAEPLQNVCRSGLWLSRMLGRPLTIWGIE